MRTLFASRAGKITALAILGLAIATVIGMIVLWPDGSSEKKFKGAGSQKSVEAEVRSVSSSACTEAQGTVQNPDVSNECRHYEVVVRSGPDKGDEGTFTVGVGSVGAAPDISVGDTVRVIKNGTAGDGLLGDDELGSPGGAEAQAPVDTYSFVDFDRETALVWLLVLFVFAALAVGRLRGLFSLLGLAASLVVVVVFIVPSILDGRPPLAVAIFGSLAVMLITIVIAHGVSITSAAAAIGTTAALLVTVVLGVFFTDLAHLTGFTSEEAAYLQATSTHISLRGLVLAGIVIGALGVLDDLTITQASTVLALRRANPLQSARQLYKGALGVGRDHIAATINTLVLAYVGASLPILLVFTVGDLPFIDGINKEVIAEQIASTLVGSIGLMSAVPLTTGLAALLASRVPVEEIPDELHAHAH